MPLIAIKTPERMLQFFFGAVGGTETASFSVIGGSNSSSTWNASAMFFTGVSDNWDSETKPSTLIGNFTYLSF